MAVRVLLACLVVGSVGKLSVNPYDTSGWVGAEYQPAKSANQDWLYHWADYKEDVTREIPMIKRVMGFTALRVFLHSMVYFANPQALLRNLDEFLDICQQSDIRVGFVFFDDCWNHAGLDLSKPCVPQKGMHNGCWMASPQDVERRNHEVEYFKPYLQDVIMQFKDDARVIWWEIFNEPHPQATYPQGNFSQALRHEGFRWAKEMQPSQAIIACWNEADQTSSGPDPRFADSELNNAHQYATPWYGVKNAVFKNETGKMHGGIVTEAGARWYQGTATDSGSPLTVIDWLSKLRNNKDANFVPGVMIDWEVMVSNSNTRWHWGTKEGAPEPAMPWCQHIFPDGTPVSYTEAAAIRRYITGKNNFYYFEDFLNDVPNPDSEERWHHIRPQEAFVPSHTLADGLVELAVWPDTDASVSLKLRVNGDDGYEVHLDAHRQWLSLSRASQHLADFNASTLECGILSSNLSASKKQAAWNMLRVLVHGGRIAVWLNPMYPEAFIDRLPEPSSPSLPVKPIAPRIDYMDAQAAGPGTIEIHANRAGAFVDYLSVLPPILHGGDWTPSAKALII